MKISHIYNLASFDRLSASLQSAGFDKAYAHFNDAYAGTSLARNLTQIDPQIFEKKFPELSFVNSGIQADNSGGWANVIESLRRRGIGGFRNAGDISGNKGKISLAGEDSSIKVVGREAESDWSNTDVQQAALSNINLVSDYISEHNRIYMREIDEIGYLGIDGITGSTGLLNYTGFTSAAAAGAIGTLTAQQMYDAIADTITAQWNAVNNTPEYKANRVDMPTYVLNTLGVTMLNTAAGSSTVLRALRDNFPDVEFRSTFRADDAGGAGVSHTVAYANNSEAMKMRIPVPLTVGEIIKVGSFSFHIDSMYRVAGLDVLEDTAGYILTGL